MSSEPLSYSSQVADTRGLAELPDHAGKSPKGAMYFFAGCPPEIGPPISAESTLTPEQRGFSVPLRIGLTLAALLAILALFSVAALNQRDDPDEAEATFYIGLMFSLIGAGAVLFFTRPKGDCTFISSTGIARARQSPILATLSPSTRSLLFADAADLRTRRKDHYGLHGAVYSRTSFDYQWFDDQGRRLFRIKGAYYAQPSKLILFKKSVLWTDSLWRFAQAAETAWDRHVIDRRANAELAASGAITFRVDSSRSLRIGPGFIEFHFGGEPVRLTTADIGKIQLQDGQFSFVHKDAGWFSRQGKYSFAYGRMANARVFIWALERLMGCRFA